MVRSRLSKRISDLGLTSEVQYLEYLRNNLPGETPALISLLTTHHTYFFREFAHFEFLANIGLKRLVDAARRRGDKTLRFWSAAASRGQEAYSLSMFLAYHLHQIAPDFTYKIFGTDIDSESVAIAKNGVYLKKEVQEIPLNYYGNHWAKGTGDIQDYVKAKGSIKDPCEFEVGNLLNPNHKDPTPFDAIFCRNVFIYFNSEQIKDVTKKLLQRLQPDGFLFIGISESLYGLGLPVVNLGPSIFGSKSLSEVPPPSKTPTQPLPTQPTQARPPVSTSTPLETPNPLRVVCVDDSPSILALLNQILTKDQGFEIVGTAKNGLEAQKKITELKPHLVTLDIHMPEQTGVEYLAKNFSSSHPPVVMITSVSREEADLGLKALTLGASDYVEKPALANLSERGDEIRTKLKCAFRNFLYSKKPTIPSDWSTHKTQNLKKPESMARIIIASLSDHQKLKSFFKELKGPQPPTLLFFEGAGAGMSVIEKNLGSSIGKKVTLVESDSTALSPDQLYAADLGKLLAPLKEKLKSKKISILVFGEVSQQGLKKLSPLNGAQLLVEETQNRNTLTDLATDIVPFSSFAYLSHQYFESSEK
jgi:chemotaxis protein methyltransferase CheR